MNGRLGLNLDASGNFIFAGSCIHVSIVGKACMHRPTCTHTHIHTHTHTLTQSYMCQPVTKRNAKPFLLVNLMLMSVGTTVVRPCLQYANRKKMRMQHRRNLLFLISW